MAVPLRDGNGRVGFVELFFDLVFVFAITQISHALLHHYSLAGAFETAILLFAVWWVWIYTTWALTWLDPDAGPVRAMLFVLMALGLFLSMAIPEAFGARAAVFAAMLVAMHLVRTGFVLAAFRGPGDAHRANFLRIFIWLAVAGLFWLAGGLAGAGARPVLWLVAMAIDVAGPVARFRVPGLGGTATRDWDVIGGHIAERCGLFIIICLGETLLISGATFAGMDWTAPGLLAFGGCVVSTIGMWWIYFDVGHRRGSAHIEQSDDPGRIARAFTFNHLPIVAGIVLAAVGAERAIAHPGDPATLGDTLVLIGGGALFLAGNGVFKRLSAPWFPLSHLVGLGLSALALLPVLLAGPRLSLLAVVTVATAILLVVAVWEHLSVGRQPRPGAHPA